MELTIDPAVRRKTLLAAAWRVPLSLAFLVLVVIGPAGTWHYWEGWLFIATICGSAIASLVWLAIHDPELLARRMKTKEKESTQKTLMRFGFVAAVVVYAFPGIDHRFDWSDVPSLAVILADALIVAAYAVFIRILRENRWASRVIEVSPDQHVVTTGPYSVVRHPMYADGMVIYAASAVALGSWWALLGLPVMLLIYVLRIRNEELVLRRNLTGYAEYADRVRYRLIPGLW